MAFRLGNNAQELASNKPASSATAFNLAGAETGRQTLVAAIGTTNTGTFIAQKVDANKNPAGAWQIFIGTVTDATPDTLSQDTLIASSTGSFIDWSATGENSAPLITAVAEESRLPRRTQAYTFAGAASYDIAMRAGCSYLVQFEGLDFSNDQVTVEMTVSTDGVTFDTAASSYIWAASVLTASGYSSSAGSNGDVSMDWSTNPWFGNGGVGEEVSGFLEIFGAGDAGTYTLVQGRAATLSYLGALSNQGTWHFSGRRVAAQADVALRIAASAGTIDAGTISVWEFPQS